MILIFIGIHIFFFISVSKKGIVTKINTMDLPNQKAKKKNQKLVKNSIWNQKNRFRKSHMNFQNKMASQKRPKERQQSPSLANKPTKNTDEKKGPEGHRQKALLFPGEDKVFIRVV